MPTNPQNHPFRWLSSNRRVHRLLATLPESVTVHFKTLISLRRSKDSPFLFTSPLPAISSFDFLVSASPPFSAPAIRFPVICLSREMPVNLTKNAISAVNGGNLNLKPLVQVLEIRPISGAQERYRILVSDGVETQQALLAVQLNSRVKTGVVRDGSVVQLVEYICSTIQNRQIIVILNMETIVIDCEVIGKPKLPAEVNSFAQTTSVTSSSRQLEVGKSCAISKLPSATASAKLAAKSNGKTPSYSSMVQPSYKPLPVYKNQGAVVRNEAPARIIPIAALNPYQGRWAIKARVTAKSELRRYNNAKGDGKVFSFDLLDSDGGEIRITCFNTVVDRFIDQIEIGKVYLISRGNLKPAQKNFNHLNNEWEILLDATSTVDPCPDEDNSIPKQQFNFRLINEIENLENNSIVDIIGIVIAVNPTTTILRKNGMETQRRIVNLKDGSGRSVDVTLWGDTCNKEGRNLQEMLDSGVYPVLAVKSGKVNDFSGKSVGTISSTQLFVNPDLPEVQRLIQWFNNGGKTSTALSISREVVPGPSHTEKRKTVSQIKDEGLGRGEKPDWVTVKATLSFIKTDNFCYTACPLMTGDRKCSKKVTRIGSGSWFCDRCNKEFDKCDYRYLLQVQVQDHTGLTWLTAFQESGEEILCCLAKDLFVLKYEEQDDAKFAEIVQRCLFQQYMFRLKIKEEIFGDEQRVKITIVKAEKVNPSLESGYLLDLISGSPMQISSAYTKF